MGGGAAGGLSNNGRHLGSYQKLEIPPQKKSPSLNLFQKVLEG